MRAKKAKNANLSQNELLMNSCEIDGKRQLAFQFVEENLNFKFPLNEFTYNALRVQFGSLVKFLHKTSISANYRRKILDVLIMKFHINEQLWLTEIPTEIFSLFQFLSQRQNLAKRRDKIASLSMKNPFATVIIFSLVNGWIFLQISAGFLKSFTSDKKRRDLRVVWRVHQTPF